jgi:predicted Zn finger-like uncharacterized protein
MLTRCPHCRTAFHVTREQLLVRDGKVRCGACRRAFNAMGYLDPKAYKEKPEPAPAPAIAHVNKTTDEAADDTLEDTQLLETLLFPEEEAEAHEEESTDDDILPAPPKSQPTAATPSTGTRQAMDVPPPTAADALNDLLTAVQFPDPIDALLAQEAQHDTHAPEDEKPKSARTSRWAEPTPDVAAEAAYPLLPFVLASLLLDLLLLFQAVYHYRGEMGRQTPLVARIFSAFHIRMPLAQEVEWLSIDASEFTPMTHPGHFQLTATLKNQSRYPQAWPQLEISLTDSYDNILTRRVFSPAEYLPPDAAPEVFAPGDIHLQLRLEASDLAPTGYRLYLFYP